MQDTLIRQPAVKALSRALRGALGTNQRHRGLARSYAFAIAVAVAAPASAAAGAVGSEQENRPAAGGTEVIPVVTPVTEDAQAEIGAARKAPGKMTRDQVEAAVAAAERERQEQWKPDPAVPAGLVDRWGVEVFGVSRTAGGYMLDFRFRVVDAEKALPLFDHRIKPYVRAEKSGINLPVPIAAKVGAFRPTNRGQNIKAGKIYYMVFANPDTHLKPGDKVSVIIGDFKAEHLTVN